MANRITWLGAVWIGGVGFLAQPLAAQELPSAMVELTNEDHVLPRYAEQYYHPLARTPVVDLLLGDALWSAWFAEDTARRLAGGDGLLSRVDVVQRAGVYPRVDQTVASVEVPGLAEELSPDAAAVIEQAWGRFLSARARVKTALAVLPDSEREWMLANPGRWFFADENLGNYRYLTCDTTDHVRIFRTAAEIDRRALAAAQRELARATDELAAAARKGVFDDVDTRGFEHVDPDTEAVLRIAGHGEDAHNEDVDVLLDLGGDDWWSNNAGGNRGTMPVAFAVDLDGDDHYDTAFGAQGTGYLGVGGLADLAGNDVYRGEDFSQGAAFIGSGFLYDLDGDDRYRARHFSQAAAGFGPALMFDADGDDSYTSSGMSGGVGVASGVGFLVDGLGDDVYSSGIPRRNSYTIDYGMGLGSGIGVRDWPWQERASFYGGLGFLHDGAGEDQYENIGAGLGGAYCLAAGIVVDAEGDDDYMGITDAFGASIHLGAAVFLDQAGDDRYRAGNSVLGCGGDRGHGVFVDFAGDDRYRVGSHGLGTGRKPKAVGLMIEVEGDDSYHFGQDSMTATWRPSNPENWAWASFIDLGGDDEYPTGGEQDVRDGLDRGNNRSWTFGPTGRGEDLEFQGQPQMAVRAFFHDTPQVDIPWKPDNMAWCARLHRPLIEASTTPDIRAVADRVRTPELVPERETVDSFAPPVEPETDPEVVAARLPSQAVAWIVELQSGTADFDARRRRYEQLDFLRFASGGTLDFSGIAVLLDNPESKPEDLLAFAGMWSSIDRTPGATERVADALMAGEIESSYARQILTRMVGRSGGPRARAVLANRIAGDPDEVVRRRAAFHLGRLATPEDLPALQAASEDPSPLVRTSVAGGLRDSQVDGANAILEPLLEDENIFVRRAAAVALLSRGDKTMVDRIMDEMAVASIDTGWNYGRNLFVTMGQYLGPELVDEMGTDLETWQNWWSENRDTHDLDASIAANEEAILERLAKHPSSE
ncbi:MAG: HEAT repeat domain-containing protein [Phycisphaerales bacterium]|nr:HEAT repeat domain-containing protein [Phycisphaerales bacterium]